MIKKRLQLLIAVICFLLIISHGSLKAANLMPLDTQDANVIEAGTLEVRIGVEYLENKKLAFDSGQKNRDEARLPSLGMMLGAGKIVEIQTLFDCLYVDETDSAYGAGDIRLSTKVQLRQEDNYPAIGLNFSTKLPNASNEDRLGTDEFDFFNSLLLSKHLGNTACHLNLGMGILGNPHHNSNQDDVLYYNLGVLIPADDTLNLALGISGQAFSNDNNDFLCLLIGAQGKRENWAWDIGGGIGLTDESRDWSVTLGITKSFNNFIKF
ncbi:MAG: hypothetical protein KAJ66_03805 [Candidatus Omnitrophica bacterium]|nr:hypothetical protein [Candidatus Omnitrophota bacterium]